jgi:hypothetical protein
MSALVNFNLFKISANHPSRPIEGNQILAGSFRWTLPLNVFPFLYKLPYLSYVTLCLIYVQEQPRIYAHADPSHHFRPVHPRTIQATHPRHTGTKYLTFLGVFVTYFSVPIQFALDSCERYILKLTWSSLTGGHKEMPSTLAEK